MKWRSEMVLAVWLVSMALPQVAAAQGPSVPTTDPACSCFVKPPEEPEEPGEEPGPDSPSNPNKRKWLVLGAAGLAVLTGIPFGATTVQGLPFAAAPEMPGAPPARVVAEAPTVETPSPAPAPAPVAAPAVPAVVAVAPAPVVPLPEVERAGMVPPKTATHLPLLAAAGVFMLGGGTVMARKGARERRRRKRFISF